MGYDFYIQDGVIVHLKDGSIRQYVVSEREGYYFPDRIFRHVDTEDKDEVDKAKAAYMRSLETREVVWKEGQELRSLYARILREVVVDVSLVDRIIRTETAFE